MEETDSDGRPGEAVQGDPELVSVVVEHDDGPDQCTIFDPETTGVDRMSNWITIDRELFVDLYHIR